ncbi:nucleotidyltransferase domain-containing protein [Pyrobaculum neutrophilum]|uniref:DNA polymerase beta domain protein region n=1 Tax=Pyrobaculum neutrophilum (strain DSM 2338 / JCM 9278 / NBRC 100436 / V24Sta) TaxID=444157 RepID=B1YCL4_PYRNV|nr:nucleotidyltransferase domain-containing protein [Pyrobaculum neutrophilum]ACB39527.1 DNA polymerase beta domain protein region [Pyrobaculum neutrophilum V24Sta]
MPRDIISLVREVEAEREARFRQILEQLCRRATAVALFGSRARGDHTPLSDWDMLAVAAEGEYRVENTPVGQIVWAPLDRLEEALERSTILLDALADAKLLCGDPAALERARAAAAAYAAA